MISCREVYGFLDEFLEGRLDAMTQLKFKAHLLICAACRRYLTTYQTALRVARDSELGEIPNHIPAPEELIQAILAARGTPAARHAE